MDSPSLPESEKSPERIKGEAQIAIGAGTLTTTHALKAATYHILAIPKVKAQLMEELERCIPDLDSPQTSASLSKCLISWSSCTSLYASSMGIHAAYRESSQLECYSTKMSSSRQAHQSACRPSTFTTTSVSSPSLKSSTFPAGKVRICL